MIDEATISGAMTRRHAGGERMKARILAAMLSIGQPATLRRIAAVAGCSFMTVQYHAATLTDDGLIVRTSDGLALTAAGVAAAKLVAPRA